MSEPPPSEAGRLALRFLGGCLAAVGFLIAGFAGLCTMAALSMMSETGLEPIVGFGGIPFVVGALIAAGGMAILRRTRRPERPTLPPASFSDPG